MTLDAFDSVSLHKIHEAIHDSVAEFGDIILVSILVHETAWIVEVILAEGSSVEAVAGVVECGLVETRILLSVSWSKLLRALAPVVVTKVLMECSPVVPVVTLAVPTGTLAIAGAPLLLLLLLISKITETAKRRILVHISTEVAKRSILMYITIEAKINTFK